jgi:hypothetical protein
VIIRTRPTVNLDPASPPRTAASGEAVFRVEIIDYSPPHIAVHRPIDLSTAAELHRHLRETSRGGLLPLTVDLTNVSHLAGAGVQFPHQEAEQMAADGRPLQLIAPTGTAAHQVLTLTALNQLADIVEALPRTARSSPR